MEAGETVRIYVCCLPEDMKGERVVLENLVLPELQVRGRDLGVTVLLADPWRRASARDPHEDLERRLREIDDCRPFFIALLGERQGPALGIVPQRLLAEHPWLADDPDRSTIEVAIRYAVLREPSAAQCSFFYFRDPGALEGAPAELRQRRPPESPRSAARLAALKDAIRASGRPILDGYSCRWNQETRRLEGLDALAARIIDDLWPAIKDEAKSRGLLAACRQDIGPAAHEIQDVGFELSVDEAELPPASVAATPARAGIAPRPAIEVAGSLSDEDGEFIAEHLAEGRVFRKYGLVDKAANQFEAVLTRFPENAEARRELREVYEEKGLEFGEEEIPIGGELGAAGEAEEGDLGAAPLPIEAADLPSASPVLPSEPPLSLHENVQFTVYRPRVVKPMHWYPLLAFAHLEDLPAGATEDDVPPIDQVRMQAERLLGNLADEYAQMRQDSLLAVAHEAEITFVLEMPGCDVNPLRRTFLWLEPVHREEFRMRAGDVLEGHVVRGRMSVFSGRILLAELSLAVRVEAVQTETKARALAERSTARPFRRIFASYSHKDVAIVEEVERYTRTLGDFHLRDVTQLRAGERWDDRLRGLIREADVFQLFWSWNALRSAHVEREWRYALSMERANFIRPTYWEEPLPALPERDLPPEDLRRLHFQLLPGGAGAHPALSLTTPAQLESAPDSTDRPSIDREITEAFPAVVIQTATRSTPRPTPVEPGATLPVRSVSVAGSRAAAGRKRGAAPRKAAASSGLILASSMIVIVFAAIVFTPFMFMRARRGASDAAPTAYSIEPPGATKVRNPDDLAAGIRQVEGGDLEAAVLTLDAVIQRLSREKGRERDLAVAHLYLGMTHLGLGQREKAAAEMRHAWNNDQEMKLDPKKFPPPVVQFYRQTTAALAMRSDRNAAALRPASPPAMSAPTNSSRQGSLDLRILPWAEVTVDGRKVGTTPLRLLTLEAGQHDVILNHPDYKPLQRRVTIRPGQIVKLEVDLALDGSPR